jgi:hypothetical protein
MNEDRNCWDAQTYDEVSQVVWIGSTNPWMDDERIRSF